MSMNRRDFLRCSCTAAIGTAAWGVGAFGNLRQLQAAVTANPTQFDDYRALVCIFLAGGNDSFNMVVPTSGQSRTDYAGVRGNLAVPVANITGVTSTQIDPFGFNNACTELANLYNAGNLAVVANCGVLVQPTTKADYENREAWLPPRLFSHSNQTTHAFTGNPLAPVTTGWAGRLQEDLMGVTAPPGPYPGPGPVGAVNANTVLSMNITLNGTNVLQRSTTGLPYNVSPNGVTTLSGLDPVNDAARNQAFNDLLTQAQAGPEFLEKAFAEVQQSSIANAQTIQTELNNLTPLTTVFPNSSLGRRLETVARMMAIRLSLGLSPAGAGIDTGRQIFYVAQGGYDTHGSQATRHPNLLQDLSQSMGAFYMAMQELGIEDNVITFTNSEFGRTLTNNGDGTDHGWGGHSVLMGGKVNSTGTADIYGTMPKFEIHGGPTGGPDDTRGGRLVPTTGFDQIGCSLLDWFGVSDPARQQLIFPNRVNFDSPPAFPASTYNIPGLVDLTMT